MNRREFLKTDIAILAASCAPGVALAALEPLVTPTSPMHPKVTPEEARALWLMRRDLPVVTPGLVTMAWGDREWPDFWKNGKPQYREWFGSIGGWIRNEQDFTQARKQGTSVDLGDIRYFCFLRMVVWNSAKSKRELLMASVTSQLCGVVDPLDVFSDEGMKHGHFTRDECDSMLLDAWDRLQKLASKYEPVPKQHWMADRGITISRVPFLQEGRTRPESPR